MIELTESWQDVFDKAVRVKKRAHRYLDEGGRRDQHGSKGEQPPSQYSSPPEHPYHG